MNEGGFRTYKSFNFNSEEKAYMLEKLLYSIKNYAERIKRLINSEIEYDGKAYDVDVFATNILKLVEELNFDPTMYDGWEDKINKDNRDIGDYGTDKDGDWKYDYPSKSGENSDFDYWAKNTKRGRKYSKEMGFK